MSRARRTLSRLKAEISDGGASEGKDDPTTHQSVWNSLEITKLATSLLTPLAVVVIGYVLSSSARDIDERRAQQIRDTEMIRARQAAVIDLSRFIYARRVRSELLASGLRRHASAPTDDSRKEIVERKHDYDAAYAEWNANSQAILLRVRATLASPDYSLLEGVIEHRLIGQGFAPLDKCLTSAFDRALRSQDPRPTLNECDTTFLLQGVLDCGYAVTNVLYSAASTAMPKDILQNNELRNEVESECPAVQSRMP